MTTSLRNILGGAVVLCSLVAAGCAAPGGQREDACAVPSTERLDLAASEVRAKLENGCQRDFNRYFNRLLDVAAGAPDPDNAREFQSLFRWSVNEGVISRVQAEDRYNRFFSTRFSNLDGKRSVSSGVCPQLEDTLADMRKELKDKQRGLQEIKGDDRAYQQATALYYDLELNLTAACTASDS